MNYQYNNFYSYGNCKILTNCVNLDNNQYQNIPVLYNTYNEWNYAPTQFAISNSESIYKGTFYGKTGDVVGTLSQNTNLINGDGLRTRAKIYDSFSYLTSDPNVGINLAGTFSNLNSIPVCNIQNIINCAHAFSQYKGDTIDVTQFDISNTTDCFAMFGESYNLININGIENFNTSNVYQFSSMFHSCYNLTNGNFLTNWNFSNASTTGWMFCQCNNLTEINIDLSNSTNLTTTDAMFFGCYNLTKLDLGLEILSNLQYINYMFKGCSNLTEITNLNIIDCSNVINMDYLFANCSNLISLPTIVNTSNVNNLAYMFEQCKCLSYFPNFNTIKVKDTSCMFAECSNLMNVYNYDFSNLYSANYMFLNCTNLVNIPVLNLNNLRMAGDMFNGCNNLSDTSYANIVNSLPNASQMYNKFVSNIGLDINRFTVAQKTILKNKGYVDMGENQYTITYS